jgi:hypothetical protein
VIADVLRPERLQRAQDLEPARGEPQLYQGNLALFRDVDLAAGSDRGKLRPEVQAGLEFFEKLLDRIAALQA